MNQNFKTVFLLLFLVMGIIFLSGCIGEKSKDLGPKAEKDFLDVIDLTPSNGTSITYINLNTFPEEMKKDSTLLKNVERELSGIDFSKLNNLAVVELGRSDEFFLILSGDFDKEETIKNFKMKGFSSKILGSREVWSNGKKYLLFFDKKVLYAEKEDSINTFLNVQNKKLKSLSVEQDVQQVLNKIPNGFTMTVKKNFEGTVGYSLRKETEFEATTVVKADANIRNEVKSGLEKLKDMKKNVRQDIRTDGDLLIVTETGKNVDDVLFGG